MCFLDYLFVIWFARYCCLCGCFSLWIRLRLLFDVIICCFRCFVYLIVVYCCFVLFCVLFVIVGCLLLILVGVLTCLAFTIGYLVLLVFVCVFVMLLASLLLCGWLVVMLGYALLVCCGFLVVFVFAYWHECWLFVMFGCLLMFGLRLRLCELRCVCLVTLCLCVFNSVAFMTVEFTRSSLLYNLMVLLR